MGNLYDDPRMDGEEFDDSESTFINRRHSHRNTSQALVTTTAAAAAATTDSTSTSPYARANLQLPKKKKERRPWRQVIKELFKGGGPSAASGIPGENGARIIHINNNHLNDEQKFLSNTVTTGKYSIWNFLPKFLYEEFSKYANIFFLFVSCIQVKSKGYTHTRARGIVSHHLFIHTHTLSCSKSLTFHLLQDGLPLYHYLLYYLSPP